MSGPPLALVLNLDAELELERGPRYQPTDATRARVEALARSLRGTLPPRAAVVDPLGEPPEPDAVPIAWCPTPRALAAIARAGIAPPAAPDVAVLARVNARPFAHALAPDELDGARLVHDVEQAEQALARPGEWLLKRIFGLSGRGQRRVRGGEASAADRAFVEASLRRSGALCIEPRVVVERELSVHAWVRRGAVEVRSIRVQEIDPHGAFVGSHLARELPPRIERTLVDAGERVGRALLDAGYEGPFGVDAYEHRGDGSRPLALRAISEINARYCMGWDERDGWLPPT